MRLRDHVTPHELPEINLLLLLEAAARVGGPEVAERARTRAQLPSDAALMEIIDEVEPFERHQMAAAWAHWMALVTIRQPFFDANHRSALMAFNLATRRAWGVEFVLSAQDMEALMRGSRQQVLEAHRPKDGRARRARVVDLRDPDPPGRRFFQEAAGRLVASRP